MTIEHFENLWELSEKIAEKYYDNKSFDYKDVLSEIRENLTNLKYSYKESSNENAFDEIGKILFCLTFLSKKLNINIFAALKNYMEDIKIEMLDPELDNKE